MLELTSKLPFTLCVLRHANTLLQGPDRLRPLSPDGIEQAKKQKALLASYLKVDLIIVSSAKRAQETASILELKAPMVVLEELYLLMKIASSLIIEKMSGKKSLHPLYAICKDKIQALIDEYKAKQILIIAHSGVLNLIGCMFDEPHASLLLTTSFSTCDGFILKKASV